MSIPICGQSDAYATRGLSTKLTGKSVGTVHYFLRRSETYSVLFLVMNLACVLCSSFSPNQKLPHLYGNPTAPITAIGGCSKASRNARIAVTHRQRQKKGVHPFPFPVLAHPSPSHPVTEPRRTLSIYRRPLQHPTR